MSYLLYAAGEKLWLPALPSLGGEVPETSGDALKRVENMIRILLSKGADPFAKFLEYEHRVVRQVDCHFRTPTIVKPSSDIECTVLHELLWREREVDCFFDEMPNLNVNHRNAEGQTLLHVLAAKNAYKNQRYPLRATQNPAEKHPLHPLTQRHIDRGADLEALDYFGRNILHYAINGWGKPSSQDRRYHELGHKTGAAHVRTNRPRWAYTVALCDATSHS